MNINLPNPHTGLVEEIIHLRKETHHGFQDLRKEISHRFENMEDKLDENTLAVQALETIMKGGFDNVGKVLQEISNKLDK